MSEPLYLIECSFRQYGGAPPQRFVCETDLDKACLDRTIDLISRGALNSDRISVSAVYRWDRDAGTMVDDTRAVLDRVVDLMEREGNAPSNALSNLLDLYGLRVSLPAAAE